MTSKRYTAVEVIGTYLGWDVNDVRDAQYQSTRWTRPAVFSIDLQGGYTLVAAPRNGKKLRDGYAGDYSWHRIGEALGREVWAATPMSGGQ